MISHRLGNAGMEAAPASLSGGSVYISACAPDGANRVELVSADITRTPDSSGVLQRLRAAALNPLRVDAVALHYRSFLLKSISVSQPHPMICVIGESGAFMTDVCHTLFYLFDRNGDAVAQSSEAEMAAMAQGSACLTAGNVQTVVGQRLHQLIRGDATAAAIPARLATEHWHVTIMPVFSLANEAVYYLVRVEPRHQERELPIDLLRMFWHHSLDGMFVIDQDGHLLVVNEALATIVGHPRVELIGRPITDIIEQVSAQFPARSSDVRLVRIQRGQETVFARIYLKPMAFGDNTARLWLGVVTDLAGMGLPELAEEGAAQQDDLTGVGTRRNFEASLATAVQTCEVDNSGLAVLFLDLDRFKPINDSLGHKAGDELLRKVSLRLQRCLRGDDVICRMGGDEFAILLQGMDAEAVVSAATRMAARMLNQFAAPFELTQQEVYTSISIGIGLYPCHGRTAESILHSADAALHYAKQTGKNNYKLYDEIIGRRALDYLIKENALRKALMNHALELVYQPQHSLANNRIVGVEALLRWFHPSFGDVSPAEFIEMAEQTDLIVPLGEWVFQRVCERLAAWRQQGIVVARIGINVSANQFKNPRFADWVIALMARYGINPASIEIEITESALMLDVEHSMKVLYQLIGANMRIAVDDFGTGYSSLNYLRKFPLHTLKIDRAFVEDLEHSYDALELTATVIALGKLLGLSVIAEGVETADQYHLLTAQGCDEVQGFYLSKGLNEAALLAYIHQHEANYADSGSL